jgi:hypothetical protein
MDNKIRKDERIMAQKRKIGNEAFLLLFYSLIISILVQQYVLNAPFIQYAVEIILIIVISLYVVTRNIILGNDLFGVIKHKQGSVIVNSLLAGLTVTTINTVYNYFKLGDLFKADAANTALISGITFLCASSVAFLILEVIYLTNRKKQKQINFLLDTEEMEES